MDNLQSDLTANIKKKKIGGDYFSAKKVRKVLQKCINDKNVIL